MKTKVMKLVVAMAFLAIGVLFGAEQGYISSCPSFVNAADPKGDKKKSSSSNKKKETKKTTTEKTTTADGETVNEDGVTSINDMNVSMDPNGKMTTSFDKASDSTRTWNTIFAKYRVVIVGISGVLTLTFIVLFLINFFKVGAASDNPVERRKALVGVLWTGLAAAGSGSVTLICALFWNALK